MRVRAGKSVRHGKACKKGEKLQKGKEDMKRKTKRHKDAQEKDTRDRTCSGKQEKIKAHLNERGGSFACLQGGESA